jgi:hypothetical protein
MKGQHAAATTARNVKMEDIKHINITKAREE